MSRPDEESRKPPDRAGDSAIVRRAPLASHWLVLNAPFRFIIRAYQATLSPLLGGHCRFHPTCSRYAHQAFCEYPTHLALAMTARRLLRCHPWGGGGYDPVPPREAGNIPDDERSETIRKA